MTGVSIGAYRAAVGIFAISRYYRTAGRYSYYDFIMLLCLVTFGVKGIRIMIILLLSMSGDVHPHPGPSSRISIVHSNIRSLKGKLLHVEAELGMYDVVCITESWLTDATTKWGWCYSLRETVGYC